MDGNPRQYPVKDGNPVSITLFCLDPMCVDLMRRAAYQIKEGAVCKPLPLGASVGTFGLKAIYRGEARQDSLDDATPMLASQKTPLIF